SRKPKIGWKTEVMLRSSMTRRSCSAMSRRLLPPSFTRPSPSGIPSRHPVAPEPLEHAFPAVLGGFLAIGGPVVGIEAVRRVRIDVEIGRLARLLERGAHALDALDGNARVRTAIEAQHGRLDVLHQLDRVLRLQLGARPFH